VSITWLGPGTQPFGRVAWVADPQDLADFAPVVIGVDPGTRTGLAAFCVDGTVALSECSDLEAPGVIEMATTGREPTLVVEGTPAGIRVADEAPRRLCEALQARWGDQVHVSAVARARSGQRWFRLQRGFIRSQHAKDALGHLVFHLVMANVGTARSKGQR